LRDDNRLSTRPAKLYKYQPATLRTLENLKLRTIWFSAPRAFNDPFDCAVDVELPGLSAKDVPRAFEYLRSRAELTQEFEAEIITDGKPNAKFREVFDRVFRDGPVYKHMEETRARIGVACLSGKNDDLPMWAHYADGHRGFCLEFDSSFDPFNRAEPVAYQANIPVVNQMDILDGHSTSQNVVEAMLRTKHICWRYEDEWRLLHKEAGTGYTYPVEALTGLYLGAAMPPGQKDVVGQLLHGCPVQLYEMKRGAGGFMLEASPVTYTPHRHTSDKQEPTR
jgi:hypothetical protein